MNHEHRRTQDLAPAVRDEMLGLLDAHFDSVNPRQFAADLAGKNWVVLVRDASNTLVGFSTMSVRPMELEGKRSTVVYSGDTIVAPGAWSMMALPRAWLWAIRSICGRGEDAPVYWLLITSGFRTYRFLPTFWREFYPRHDAPTPVAIQQRMRRVAGELFEDQFDPASGIVRLRHPSPLKPELARVPAERLGDPHVRFFLERNPGHARGDELVSIADLSVNNLSAAGRRIDPVARGEFP